MFLALDFVFPAILTAAAAAAAPIIIHLILRTKPRLITFPAMRFVKKTHQANMSKLRLKHLILLAMRMAAILLIVGLIARAQQTMPQGPAGDAEPAAIVIVVDNSGSMGYTRSGTSNLDRGKRLAADMVQNLPTGSRVAVVAASDPGVDLGDSGAVQRRFLADRRMATDAIGDVGLGHGSQGIGPAVTHGAQMLARMVFKRKELVVVTDLTEQSLKDMQGIAKAPGVNFTVIDTGVEEPMNAALGEVHVTPDAVPLGADVRLDSVVTSTRLAGEVPVAAELGTDNVGSVPLQLTAGSASAVQLVVTPAHEGPNHGRLVIQREDPLAMDNVRYFTINVGLQPRILILRDASTIGKTDHTTLIIKAAIAPTAGGIERPQEISNDHFDESVKLDTVDVVILSDVSALADAQWQRLEAFVRNGGHVWVVPGSLTSPDAYNSAPAQAVVPVRLKSLEQLGQPVKFDTSRLASPLLQPFTTPDNPPLSQIEVYRRMAIAATAENASVPLFYADRVPAIVTRPLGEGSVIFWNFSPLPDFSNLSSRPHMVLLAARTVRVLSLVDRKAQYELGQTAAVAMPRTMRSATATLRRPGSSQPEPIAPDLRTRSVSVPCERVGHYTVEFTDGPLHQSVGFAVNAQSAESDLTRAGEPQIRGLFPPGQLSIVTDGTQLAAARAKLSGPLDLATPVLVGLLALMIGESYFANRFYRKGSTALEKK